MIVSLLISFLSSFVATLLIIRYKHLHERFTLDFDISGPQKFHTHAVPRIGGISIAAGIFSAILAKSVNISTATEEITLIICSIPVFAIGLTEDLTKRVSVRLRLLVTGASATLVVYLMQTQITRLDIPFIDLIFLIPTLGVALTIFAITGLANAYNIIDGFNGLASMVGIITLLAISYISLIVGDQFVMFLSLIMISALLGFFIWNYPRGLIFLGDGGAYLIGFWIASLCIILTNRHQEISPWFAVVINSYPIVETIFTIYRRKIHQGKSPGQPDGIHFHTLIFRRLLTKQKNESSFSANAKTAPYLWLLTILGVAPAIIWWRSTPALFCSCIVFVATYILIYRSMVRFKTPKWLKL